VFGLDPHQLVAGTDYPIARAERLPMTSAIHTRVDLARDTLDHVELERIDRAKQSLRFAHGADS